MRTDVDFLDFLPRQFRKLAPLMGRIVKRKTNSVLGHPPINFRDESRLPAAFKRSKRILRPFNPPSAMDDMQGGLHERDRNNRWIVSALLADDDLAETIFERLGARIFLTSARIKRNFNFRARYIAEFYRNRSVGEHGVSDLAHDSPITGNRLGSMHRTQNSPIVINTANNHKI